MGLSVTSKNRPTTFYAVTLNAYGLGKHARHYSGPSKKRASAFAKMFEGAEVLSADSFWNDYSDNKAD